MTEIQTQYFTTTNLCDNKQFVPEKLTLIFILCIMYCCTLSYSETNIILTSITGNYNLCVNITCHLVCPDHYNQQQPISIFRKMFIWFIFNDCMCQLQRKLLGFNNPDLYPRHYIQRQINQKHVVLSNHVIQDQMHMTKVFYVTIF